MKSILFVLFLSIGMSIYSANSATVDQLSINLERIVPIDLVLQKANKSDENIIAYNSYYVFEWLYKDSPFIKKLIVLV